MLNLTRNLMLVGAAPVLTACTLLAIAGCTGGGAPPVATSQARALPLQGSPTREPSPGTPRKIYVVNAGDSTLTTYKSDGTPTTPTITDSISDPLGVAVDRNGKIYVANGGNGLVTTYDRFGNRTNPTIDVAGPTAIAVDANGKIYVGTSKGLVAAYKPDGSRTTPTIYGDYYSDEIVDGVAVDKNGEIYVTWTAVHCGSSCYGGPVILSPIYHSYLAAYNADGSYVGPYIGFGSSYDVSKADVGGSAVDADGRIYVAVTHLDTLRTYDARGRRAKPTVRHLSKPSGVSIDESGNVYVTNEGNDTLTTYTSGGSPTIPTISGLDDPTGVAIH